MLATILAGLRARAARLVLSSLAIALGVAFVTGTQVLGAAMDASMRDELATNARNVDARITVETTQPGQSWLVSPQTLDAVRRLPEVAAADGRGYREVPLLDGAGKAVPAVAAALETDQRLLTADLLTGRLPTNPTEIAVQDRTAVTRGLTVGQQVTLLGRDDQPRTFTLVGTYQQALSRSSLYTSDQVLLLPEALAPFADEPGFLDVVAVAAPGVSQDHLVRALTAVTTQPGISVVTGAAYTQQLLDSVASQAGQFTYILTGFALVALVVAAMVIYNTFTILVAQRTRELALLRCVGADRGQVFRGVLAEAVAMGLVAALLGLLGGIGVSALLQLSLGTLGGTGLRQISTPVSLSTVLLAFGVGVLVTVLAAVLPAHRATRVAPVAAMRSQPDSGEEVARTSGWRLAAALLLALAGVGALVVGGGVTDEAGMTIVAGGTMLLLGAVVTLGPLLIGPVNRVLGTVPALVLGVPAKLAAANAGRNPKRTAATMAALMIGVTVVSMVTVVATSAKATANAEIDQQLPADYTIVPSLFDRTLPTDLADRLAALDEVATAAPTRDGGIRLTGVPENAAHVWLMGVSDGVVGTLVRPETTTGQLGALNPGELVVSEQAAKRTGLTVGSTVPVTAVPDAGGGAGQAAPDGPRQDLRVVAVYRDASGLADAMVAMDTFTRLHPEQTGYDSILVKLADGVSPAAGRAAVERVTAATPIARIDSAAETKAELSGQLDQILAFVWALMGLAVVIALFGITNTLTLSVLERTRESALLRALGLTRGQLRLMLVVESILMALMGSILGLALGIGCGWLMTERLSSAQTELLFTVPYGQIGVLLLGAAVAAVLAAALPARRAARSSVVAGMATA